MQWKKDGTFDQLNGLLRGDVRVDEGSWRQPSAANIDSQSVRTIENGGLEARTPIRGSTIASGASSWVSS
jgi:hypothetical protein